MGGLDPKRFFTEEEKINLQDATREAESRTIGEIVVMVVGSSAEYGEAEVMGAALFASPLSFALSVLLFHSSVWAFILIAVPAFLAFWSIFGHAPRLKMAFVGKRKKEEMVKRRAFAAFHEHGLYRTKQNTGVLFFISLAERTVWVLADRGIYEKIGQGTLDEFAANVSRGIRAGRACSTLCEEIRRIGDLLSTHFPSTPDDLNELPDAIITDV